MKNLFGLLRNLLYHLIRAPRQAANLATAGVLVVAGLGSSDGHFVLFGKVEHLLHFMVVLIGSAVVLNIILRHSNELLELLVKEQEITKRESHRSAKLLKKLLGFGSDPKDGSADSKNDVVADNHQNEK